MPEPFRTTVSPRWSDQDPNGHVNHAAVVTLLEESRIRWRSGMPGHPWPAGAPTVVAALELNYRRPVTHGEDLTVDLWVTRIGSSSFTLNCEARQNGLLAVDGRTVLVSVTPEAGAPRPLEEPERRWLEDFQTEAHQHSTRNPMEQM
ncbi:acyl-CoA thioesterase [Pseudarthrobacter sp. S3]|uniref:acyl-CoA thioesterase n=1 Tax=Pseudarthrobacter sp. S3 TaxID=3418419 RepID=UPI003CEE0BB2